MFKSMALCAVLLGGGMSSLSAVTFNVDKASFVAKGDFIREINVYKIVGQPNANSQPALIQTFNLQHQGEDQWSFPISLSALFEEVKQDIPSNQSFGKFVRIILEGRDGGGRTVTCDKKILVTENTDVNSLDNKTIATFSYIFSDNSPTCKITDRQ